jgi:hypothetical protein
MGSVAPRDTRVRWHEAYDGEIEGLAARMGAYGPPFKVWPGFENSHRAAGGGVQAHDDCLPPHHRQPTGSSTPIPRLWVEEE